MVEAIDGARLGEIADTRRACPGEPAVCTVLIDTIDGSGDGARAMVGVGAVTTTGVVAALSVDNFSPSASSWIGYHHINAASYARS